MRKYAKLLGGGVVAVGLMSVVASNANANPAEA
jgi:serine/threonine protein phosphatase PrpC